MAELIPRQVLFGNPERISPRISPDASTLAWIAPYEGVLNVWTAPGAARTRRVDWAAARVVTDDTDRGIRMFAWAHDGRHLLYLQDTGGDENWRLHDVDLQTMQRRDLTPFEGVRAQIIATEKKFPTDILIGLNRDNPQLHDVYRLDLVTGELVKEVENPGFVGWLADAELVVRGAASRPSPTAGMVVHGPGRRRRQDWRPLLSIPADDALTSQTCSRSARTAGRCWRSARSTRTPRGWSGSTWPARRDRGAGRGPRGRRGRGRGCTRTPRSRRSSSSARTGPQYLVLDPDAGGRPGRDPRAAPRRPRACGHGDDADRLVAARLHQRHRPGAVLRLRPAAASRAVPVRAPARAEPLPARADGAVLVHRAGRADHPRLRHVPAGAGPLRACPPCSTCTAARGRATPGASTPRRSGSPTAATCACR